MISHVLHDRLTLRKVLIEPDGCLLGVLTRDVVTQNDIGVALETVQRLTECKVSVRETDGVNLVWCVVDSFEHGYTFLPSSNRR